MEVLHHDIGRDPLYKIWHYINGNMIIYMYSDGGSIVFQDKIYPIKKGALCFIGADKQLHTMPDNPSIYNRSKIIIPENIVRGFLNLQPEKDDFYNLFTSNSVVYAQIPPDKADDIETIFKEAEVAFSEKERDTQTIMCCFFRLLIYIKKYATEHTSLPDDFMTTVIEIINRNYSQDISLDRLCSEIHMSKYHFCRKFKNTMGITVMEYILKTRLAAAKDALLLNQMTIREISERCGFSSVSYFCQVFKQSTGITASAYRKRMMT